MVTMAEIARDVAVNPDAQAAVTDFLDYTEYLPADLIRSLTLIRNLDEIYVENESAVNDLTRTYGTLPLLPAGSKPRAQHLRLQISSHLDRALNARESAYAEACRLFDMTDRHQNRLKSIIAKLQALPKPPSRDPTPQPQATTPAKRSRSGRKLENGMSATRLTLKPPKGPPIAMLGRPRHRRVTVPGEVMPPFDPDEPLASTEISDWESAGETSPVRPILKLKQPKPPKPPRQPSDTVEKKPRETATYRKPTPPPEDAELGGIHRPWLQLTEYEMYRLRKKMKKNHTWEPSEVMIRRELAEKGRNMEEYVKAKADAKAKGIKFLDVDITEKAPRSDKAETPKTTPVVPTPSSSLGHSKSKPTKKPELRKDGKIEPPKDKAALAAQEAELAARRLGDIGSAFKNLFSPLSSALASLNRSTSSPTANSMSPAGKRTGSEKAQKKRKADEAGLQTSPSVEPETQKRPKIIIPNPKTVSTLANETPSAGTIKIPLKLNINPQVTATTTGTTSSTMSTPVLLTRQASVTRGSIAPKTETESPAPSRPVSRRSVAASVEPPTTATRSSRRTSTTPATALNKTPTGDITPKSTAPTAASRRSKRDAPGTVMQSSQDGGAAVSISRRKSKPSKTSKVTPTSAARATTSGDDLAGPQIRIDIDGNQEVVDPDEERYCVCGDVSWGEMICCELDEKCDFGQWFHMECIALSELPPRTIKWYCPGDRKKYRKGETSNGLVGRGIK